MTRKKLKELLAIKVSQLGYSRVSGTTSGAMLHLFKRSELGLVLSLGIQCSRSFKESFTGSFYLCPTFTWSYMPPTFPTRAYARVGRFLDADERLNLLPSEHAKPGVVDAWWAPYCEDSVLRFCDTVAACEDRFLKQQGMVEAVLQSDDVKEHLHLVKTTISLARSDRQYDLTSNIAPSDLERFARVALEEMCPQRATSRVQSFLAIDAYRCMHHGVL